MNPARLFIIRSTDSYGGAERQIVGFARRFNKRLLKPVVCTFSDDGGEDNPLLRVAAGNGIETAVINASKGFDPAGIHHLAEFADHSGVDIFCPQDYRANVYAVAAARRLKVPVVATAHGYTGHTRSVRLYETMDRLAVLHAVDKVVCVSEALRKRLRHWGNFSRKLLLVHNSIDPEGSDSPLSGEPLPLDTSGERIVCSVGRLSVEKGHRFLLRAWQDVLTRRPEAKLVFVGDGPERQRLENQAEELGIAPSVVFAGFTDRPMDYLHAADLFVLPSLIEGLPVALLEACAAGKPVVASNVGGVGEVIESGVNGMLVKAGRPLELSATISDLLDDPARMSDFGIRARRTIEERFSFDKNVSELEKIYLSVLGGVESTEHHTDRMDVSKLCKE